MKKRIGRRLVSLLLTFVTVLTMLPAMTLPALAANKGNLNLTDESIGLSFTGDAEDPWSVNGEGLFGRVTSDKGSVIWYRYESTLTITNKKTTSATLSFDYTFVLNKGTIKVDGNPPSGTFSKKLEKDESIKVYIKSGKDKGGTEITITNVNLISEANPTVTFQPAKNGSYTVNGKRITEAYANTQSSTTAYQVVATPADGYQFLGWYDVSNEKYISIDAKTDLNFDSDRTITARFASKTAALFETGGQPFDDLGDAVTYAQTNGQSKITLATDGSIDGSYTIPAGITLLIPFDAAGTLYTSEPGYVNTAETQKAYKTLTMAPGSSIMVNGAISVGGKHFAGSSGSCCKATGPYGQIIMQEGSAIKLNRDANLYAWGYITGDGQITANSGATVYEYFQVMDWRGGNATLSMTTSFTNRVFPISQYYVQNIEAPLTIQNGATEKAYFSVDAAVVHTKSITIDFIGSKKSLFRIYDGTLTKKYDPKTDRITYTTTGSASLDSLALSIATYTMNSENYVLPVSNNMTLNILSGNIAVNCDAALLPGAQITIAQGAELKVSTDKSLYVYDYNTETNEWGKYCYDAEFKPILYSPTPDRHVRKEADLVDAKINVNGTLTAAGSVYTTNSGANICSSEGTGKFVQKNMSGNKETTRQAKQNGTDISYADIPITPAKLKNASADKPYTETSTAKAGETFTYCTCTTCGGGKWTNTNGLQVAAINDSTGKQVTTHNTLQDAVKQFSQSSSGNTYIKLLHNTTENINITRDIYLDLNGRTVTGDISATNGHKLYGMDNTTDTYNGTNPGKIVGKVNDTTIAPVFETKLKPNTEYDSLRYVAIKNEDGTEYTFHRFNISVSGYRFELAAPECALFFIGKFQGDKAAKDYLTSLGFTLTGKDGKSLGTDSCLIPENIPEMPSDGEASESKVVRTKDGAFLFEAYLMRSFDKGNRNGYTEKIKAIAQATFKNNVETQNSEPKQWSFEDAWTEPEGLNGLTPEQKTILDNFLNALGITNP